ncbi:MAG: TIM barrel protein [Candidatus Bathyarchaeota archaeon]|nr:TIM barrel protein [Candidatus Bathyarchaeota archaeon]
MVEHARFGPAGVPPVFRVMGAKTADVPKLLREEGLDAFEYAAVRWGQYPQIKQEEAQKLGVAAKQNDVKLSVHASYFINLAGEPQIVQASKNRLIAAATAAHWMGAYVVVFHAGFYGKNSKPQTYKKSVQAIKEVLQTLKDQGIQDVKLGPETMGRHSQFGTIEEIVDVCEEIEQTQLVIDWGHMHARSGGQLKTPQDFREIINKAEHKLGIEAVRNMHCHFSKIEYTYKSGEKRHHQLDNPAYGPEFENLAHIIKEYKMHPTIICETPMLDIDAKQMRDTLQKIQETI